MPATPQPLKLTIRSYRVGFGDCFLLTFDYVDRTRHVLIDFGTTRRPDGSPSDLMVQIAKDIRTVCGDERLHAVVATHRHRDHISGFAGASGAIIRELNPEIVIQPWTEHPQAEEDALAAPASSTRRNFLATLVDMHEVAARAWALGRAHQHDEPALAERLSFLGEDNVKNLDAVKALLEMGEKHYYVHEGRSAGLAWLLPGVRVHVLGPPNLEQTEEIRRQVHEHEDEFWHLQALEGRRAATGGLLFPHAATARDRRYARSFRRELRRLSLEQLLEIVTALDDALNNTSLILLFECAGQRFLFPGDAQWENWQHALGKERYVDLLRGVNVYKVGHHGSLNATPKSLWRLFEQRASSGRTRMTSLLSTLSGKHGHVESRTEVPRTTLRDALAAESDLVDTEALCDDRLCHVLEIDFQA